MIRGIGWQPRLIYCLPLDFLPFFDLLLQRNADLINGFYLGIECLGKGAKILDIFPVDFLERILFAFHNPIFIKNGLPVGADLFHFQEFIRADMWIITHIRKELFR